MYPDYTNAKHHVTAILTDIGEGYSGDYDPSDPDDAPLYRIDLFCSCEQEVGTNCTQIVANSTDTDYQSLVDRIAVFATNLHNEGNSLRRIAAAVSWFDNDTLTDHFGRQA